MFTPSMQTTLAFSKRHKGRLLKTGLSCSLDYVEMENFENDNTRICCLIESYQSRSVFPCMVTPLS